MPSSFLAPSTPQDPSYRSDPDGDFLLRCGLPWQKLPLEPFPRFFPRSSRPRVRKNQPPTPTIYCENRNRGWSLPKTSCWFCSSSEPPSLLLLFYFLSFPPRSPVGPSPSVFFHPPLCVSFIQTDPSLSPLPSREWLFFFFLFLCFLGTTRWEWPCFCSNL